MQEKTIRKAEIKSANSTINGEPLNNKPGDVELVKYLNQKYKELKSELAKVIVGHDNIIDQIFIAILSRGHCLLVGVPGLAKTLLVKTLSEVLELKFSRIQFTPDLMPSDIIGTEIIEEDMLPLLASGHSVRRHVCGCLIGEPHREVIEDLVTPILRFVK